MTQTVLITGTSSGMGRELTAQFAHRGWNVVATTRSAASRTDVHQLPGVVATDLDVTDPARARQVVAEALDRFGAIDVLINNAGFAQLGALEEIDLDGWRAQYETNVFGLVSVTRAVLPSMRARRAGHIILISSMGGHVSLPTMTAYTSSKFAVEGVGEGLAKEVAPLGINVTIAEPAGFGTSFSSNARPAPHPIEDYQAARQAMRDFAAHSVRGDLQRSMSAIADIAGTPQPPRRLAVGSYGLEMVRGKMTELAADYDTWEHVTITT